MKVRFATTAKALEASAKHFDNQYNEQDMVNLATAIIKNVEYIGESDRANSGHTTAKILWSTINGTMFAIVIDGKDIAKNIATVVSIYDVHNAQYKIKRFGMKKVK